MKRKTALELARDIQGMCRNAARAFARETSPAKVQQYFGDVGNAVDGLIAQIEHEHGNAQTKIAEAKSTPSKFERKK